MILNLLKKIATSLNEKHISYMLSGSMALNYYSVPRMTLDIDIIIELFEENLPDFLSIFKDGYYLDPETVNEEIKLNRMFNAIDYETGFKVDFILRKNSEYRKLEFSRRRKINIAYFDVWIVSPEDLIISKIEWIQQYQSEKQKNDIIQLLKTPEIDYNYILKWCKNLNLNTFDLI
jgi:hypothetical protein